MTAPGRVPALRPDVTLEHRPGDADAPAALFDPLLGRRLRLDTTGLAVAAALDSATTLDALSTSLSLDAAEVDQIVATLTRLHLLQTPAARAHTEAALATRAHAVADAATVPLLIREDARFTCTMCGSCCGGHNIGPVTDDVLENLGPDADALLEETGSAKGLFFELPTGDGGGQVLCHSSGGSCIFLDDTRRCRLHSRYGAHAKPRPCRIFPYELTATPRGVAVTIQRECRGFLEARGGRRLVDDEAAIREILALVPGVAAVRPLVRVAASDEIDWATYERLESALHDCVDAGDGDPAPTFLAMRAALGSAPGARIEVADACTPGVLRAEFASLDGGFADALTQIAAAIPPPPPGAQVRTESLDHLRAAVATLRPDWRRVVRRPDSAEIRALFKEHLHHALMAKQLTTPKTLRHGLGRIIFGWWLATALAIHRARQVKRRHLIGQDQMDALVVISFMTRHDALAKSLLPRFDEAFAALFVDRLGGLIDQADLLADPRTDIELVQF